MAEMPKAGMKTRQRRRTKRAAMTKAVLLPGDHLVGLARLPKASRVVGLGKRSVIGTATMSVGPRQTRVK